MNVVILVPRRAGVPERDRLWEFCRPQWEQAHPDWRIVEGHHDVGPFNRSAAVNRAAIEAGRWDVAVIIDADVLADPDAATHAATIAAATGRLVVSHNERIMLNKAGTSKILGGYRGPWRKPAFVDTVFTDSVSCCIAIPRALWDEIGGFDEHFVGWGFEDTAFQVAAETFGGPLIRLVSGLYHLHHTLAPETDRSSPLCRANMQRRDAYLAAAGDRDAIRALLDEPITIDLGPSRIPRILHRTLPAKIDPQVERWWDGFGALHRGWELRTYREPVDPADFPLTRDLWGKCKTGAQKAGLIRLEAIVTHGGVYIDSDCEPFASLEPLMCVSAFAAWEDETTIPDAVLGCEPQHPAFVECLERAREVVQRGHNAYQSGPAITTAVLASRSDVLVLPPGAFYPFHYLQKEHADDPVGPWTFLRHRWAGSWLNVEQRRSITKNQRR